ncbi:Uncharacterised protein [Yersinia enterocolitica]|nr:Uncharacterised protein [Yersinia enterocolitica]
MLPHQQAFTNPMIGWPADADFWAVSILAQVAAIALAAVSQHIDHIGQWSPLPGAYCIVIPQLLMFLSPIDNPMSQPARHRQMDTKHGCAERYSIKHCRFSRQITGQNRPPHRVGQCKTLLIMASGYLTLHQLRKIFYVIIKFDHMPAVTIIKYSPRSALPTMIQHNNIIALLE